MNAVRSIVKGVACAAVAIMAGNSFADTGYSHLYEWLESDGSQIIDLGVKMQAKTMVEIYFQRSSSASTMQKFFGAYTAASGAGAAVGCSTALSLSSKFDTSWLPGVAVGGDMSVRMHVQNAYQANGGYQYSLPKAKTAGLAPAGRIVSNIIVQDLNYYAFGVNVDNDVGAKGAIRIKRILIMSDSGEVLHDWRAAAKDGKGGLVDLLTGEFCGNIVEGANAFLCGPEVETGDGSLTIATDPDRLPIALQPAAGTIDTLTIGETVPVSAPEMPYATEHLTTTCTGWTLYSWNADSGAWVEDTERENHSGTGTSFTYTHTGTASKLVWHYALTNPAAVAGMTYRYVWNARGRDAVGAETSWTTPYYSVQAAVNGANPGDVILVGPECTGARWEMGRG